MKKCFIKKIVRLLFVFFVVVGFSHCQRQAEPLLDMTPKQIDVGAALKKGQFKLVIDASMITVTTIKNGDIPVKGSLNLSAGSLNLAPGSGGFTIDIDLMSWNSGLTARDDNILKTFFNSVNSAGMKMVYAVSSLDAAMVQTLQSTKKLDQVGVQGILKYRDKDLPVSATLKAGFNQSGRLVVETVKPFSVRISDLGLSENLKNLMTICNHQSVDDVVAIEVSLEFEPF